MNDVTAGAGRQGETTRREDTFSRQSRVAAERLQHLAYFSLIFASISVPSLIGLI